MYYIVLILGILFVLYSIFFSSGNKSKFSSDLPKDKRPPFYKTKKGLILACLLTLLILFSVYLIVSLLI